MIGMHFLDELGESMGMMVISISPPSPSLGEGLVGLCLQRSVSDGNEMHGESIFMSISRGVVMKNKCR